MFSTMSSEQHTDPPVAVGETLDPEPHAVPPEPALPLVCKPPQTARRPCEDSDLEPVWVPPVPPTIPGLTIPATFADLDPELRCIRGDAEPYLRFGVLIPCTDTRYRERATELLSNPTITTWFPRIADPGRRGAVRAGHFNDCRLVIETRLAHLLGRSLRVVFQMGYTALLPSPEWQFYPFYSNRWVNRRRQAMFTPEEIERCVQCVKEAWNEPGDLQALWYFDSVHYEEAQGLRFWSPPEPRRVPHPPSKRRRPT